LDNHTFNTLLPDSQDKALGFALCKSWAQLAEHYKNRSDRIIFEVFNEPHGITGEAWGAIQGRVIDVIRAIDANVQSSWAGFTTIPLTIWKPFRNTLTRT
jgi:endoglucanase